MGRVEYETEGKIWILSSRHIRIRGWFLEGKFSLSGRNHILMWKFGVKGEIPNLEDLVSIWYKMNLSDTLRGRQKVRICVLTRYRNLPKYTCIMKSQGWLLILNCDFEKSFFLSFGVSWSNNIEIIRAQGWALD